jgi:hypothetical protein
MIASSHLSELEQQLAPHRQALLEHPVYQRIDRIDALHCFMEHHVCAVWDFMSLLKALQGALCCVAPPWTPPLDARACRMLNEIVLAEESDDDGHGGYASHFELYRQAMQTCGASTAGIDALVAQIRGGTPWSAALEQSTLPSPARRFVAATFALVESGDVCALAASFTFGREDLLPDVFQRIVDELNDEAGGALEPFRYYLERHIGLDGDEHGPLARRLVADLCGADADRWQSATDAAVNSLVARRALWDGIAAAIGA